LSKVEITNDSGFYEFKDVIVGIYDIKFKISWGKKEINSITLSLGEDKKQDVSLDNLTANEIILVSGEMSLVEYRSGLHQAVANDNFKEAENLIINGANVNQKDENYNNITPIFLAVENGNVELVEILLNFGARINARDDNKQTPLMRLDSDASAELVRLLLGRGAKANAVDADGNTPLISAAENSASAEILQILLESGANPNAQNKQGQTALMKAAENDQLESVRALLVAGANPNLKNKDGDTAWNLTSSNEIETLLESYGAETE
jgi:ankyrin repeat protein